MIGNFLSLVKNINLLEKEALNKIIEQLETNNSESDAYWAIYSDEVDFAKANKEGLELFAAKLLRASRDFNDILEDTGKDLIHLDSGEEWIEGDIIIDCIELVTDRRIATNNELNSEEEIQKDGLWFLGCIIALIFLITSIIVGVITMIKWLF